MGPSPGTLGPPRPPRLLGPLGPTEPPRTSKTPRTPGIPKTPGQPVPQYLMAAQKPQGLWMLGPHWDLRTSGPLGNYPYHLKFRI